MQKKSIEILLKERSARASLSAGFQLYMENFRRIFKSTWIAGVITSIVCGITATVIFIWWPELIARVYTHLENAWEYADEYRMMLIVIGILTLLSFIATAIWGGYGAALLKQHQAGGAMLPKQRHLHWEGHMAWRSVKAWFWCVLLFTVFYGIVFAFIYWKRGVVEDPMHHVVSLCMAIVLFSVVTLLMVPLAYLSVKYLMDDKTSFWPLLFKRYGTSLRYWGRQFVVLLVCAIILGLLCCIVSLPEIILYEANWQARIGVVGGDPLGMPDSITILTFVTCALSSFMQLYITLPLLFCLYYMYGSIDARENEKKERMKKQITSYETSIVY